MPAKQKTRKSSASASTTPEKASLATPPAVKIVSTAITAFQPTQARESGWSPLPFSFKVLCVLLALSVLASIAALGRTPFVLFGAVFSDIPGLLASLVLNVAAPLVLLAVVWKRLAWGWKFGLAYLAFFFVNGLVGLVLVVSSTQFQQAAAIAAVMFVVLLVQLGLLVALYRRRGYFE